MRRFENIVKNYSHLGLDYKVSFIIEETKKQLAKTEENPKKAQEYDIMSIPAVKMFRDGKVIDEFIGLIPESAIRTWIDRNL